MGQTHTTEQLLIVAMQDLADAEAAWGEHGDDLVAAAGTDVARFLADDMTRSAGQHGRLVGMLGELGAPVEGDPNIWLRAIIDDAHRDSKSILAGPLRDIALIGAFRKGKQAERVSYETAIMLAELIERPSFASTLTECRDEEAAADERLAALLIRTVEPAK